MQPTLKQRSLIAEREYLSQVLQHCRFNKTKAAEKLGIDRKTLYNKLKAIPRISDSTDFYSENYLRTKEAELVEQLLHVRALLKLWNKPESRDNLHHTLRNEGEHIVQRTPRKTKNSDWEKRYVPSSNDLHNRLRTSLLDQPIE